LVLVGSGEELPRLQRWVADKGLSKRVELPGHVHNHGLLRELYGRAFCAVSPGYVGLGAIQAFSMGVPLVLADAEPHAPEREACREGENTVYFKAGDADALAAGLERMWAEREPWLARRRELAKWTARHYSVETMVEGFVEAIDGLRTHHLVEV
jgi:glycosyltransferase involved in cell wall biosynthesis